jgi:hypothetical protein
MPGLSREECKGGSVTVVTTAVQGIRSASWLVRELRDSQCKESLSSLFDQGKIVHSRVHSQGITPPENFSDGD